MYVPDPFVLHDQAAIAGLLQRHSFALLVTAAGAALRETGGAQAREVAAPMESPDLDP